jgi:predicted transcriptional regulator
MIVPQADQVPLDHWQIKEIKQALKEADRGEFASDEEVQLMWKKVTISNLRQSNDKLRSNG